MCLTGSVKNDKKEKKTSKAILTTTMTCIVDQKQAGEREMALKRPCSSGQSETGRVLSFP